MYLLWCAVCELLIKILLIGGQYQEAFTAAALTLKVGKKVKQNTQTISRHRVCDVWISPVLCMWSLASSNSLMCWLVMGLKEPQASKTSGTRQVAILVYPPRTTVKESWRKAEKRITNIVGVAQWDAK